MKIKVIVKQGFSGPLVGSWGVGETYMPEWIARKMAPSGLVIIQAAPVKKPKAAKAASKAAKSAKAGKTKTTK